MRKILLGIAIGFVLAVFLFGLVPGMKLGNLFRVPGSGKIIISPTETQKKVADLIARETREGKLVSRVDVSPEVNILPGQSFLIIPEGMEYRVPATGQVKTIYVDQFGRKIGEGVTLITGETIVLAGPDRLDIQTVFRDEIILAIDIVEQPKLPKKIWHLGGYLGSNFDQVYWGGFGRMDFFSIRSKLIDLVGFGQIDLGFDQRLLIGIEGNF